jgi:hypothetical protein
MMSRRRLRVPALTRLVASLATALVLALTVFAASPELHQWLHGHDSAHPNAGHNDPAAPQPADDDDEGCVVTLFAQGLVLALSAFALVYFGRVLRQLDRGVPERIVQEEPHFRLLPAQAPPARLR